MVDGVDRCAVPRVDARDAERELVQVRAADDARTGGAGTSEAGGVP